MAMVHYPAINADVTVVMISGSKLPGKWDGVHWWAQAETAGPFLPVVHSFVDRWESR